MPCVQAAVAHEAPLLLGEGAGSEEVQRLLQEREALLASGAYARGDPLIQQLDNRIREWAAAAAGASRAATGEAPPAAAVGLAQA